ncbi:MAG: DUF3048 domain-containing protein [Acidimicrobiales bacterium]
MPDETIPDGPDDTGDDVGDGAGDDADATSILGPSDQPDGADGGSDGATDAEATGVMETTGGPDTTGVMDPTTGVMDPTTAGPAATASANPGAGAATGDAGNGPRHAKGSVARRGWLIAIAAVVVVLAAAGIALGVSSGKKSPKAAPAPTEPHSSAATMIPAPTGPACPLTGQPAPGGSVPQRPALAFKVDNYPAARPQSGLDNADIVFEEPVEGGITRLVAVFQCQEAALVGPIRSARAVDVPILDLLSRPLLVHAGGIDPVIALLNSGNLINDDVFTHGSIVQHLPGRVAPYNTYASTAAAWALNPTDTTAPAPIFTYSSTVPTGTAVGSVHIPFSGTNDNTWTWNPLTGTWLLSIGATAANVADGGARITATDLVVQTVHTTLGPWLENSEGGLEVQSQLTGSGPLAVFRNGVEITGTWQRASLSDSTSLVAADGTPITLEPGRTWVELVPTQVAVTTAPAVPGTL